MELTEFTLFPKLVVELQLKIWKYAIPGPRVIELKTHVPDWLMDEHLRYRNDYDWAADQTAALQALEFTTNTTPCGLLGACVTSRKVILEVYQSVVASKGGRMIRFDGNNDAILLNTEERRRMDQSPLGSPGMAWPGGRDYSSIFSGIKRLIWFETQFWACHNNLWVLAQFQSLKELVLLQNPGCFLLPNPRNNPVNSDRYRWKAFQKQLACASIRLVLSKEDLVSPPIETLEEWELRELRNYMQESRSGLMNWSTLARFIHTGVVDYKRMSNLTKWEIPEITQGYVLWERR